MSSERDHDGDWLAFGLEIVNERTAWMREGCSDMARFIAALDPMPPGAEVAAVKMLGKAYGFDLSRAMKEYRQIKAEVRREQMRVA